MAKKQQPSPPTKRDARLQQLILRIVMGQTPDDAASEMRLSAKDAPKLIAQARKQITLAANYHRDEQLGLAISRLNDVYSRAAEEEELKVCMQAQKELNRLLNLHSAPDRAVGLSEESQELAAIREYLLPYNLAGDETPATSTAELVRLAVARLPA